MIDRTGTVLIVEDDADTRRLLRTTIEHGGYDALEAPSGTAALATVRATPVDLTLLDLGLPDMDGANLITSIRSASDVPIIVLSGCALHEAKIDALDRGANDYVTKPFAPTEVLARIRAVLRTLGSVRQSTGPTYQAGEIRLDADRQKVWRRGKELRLTPNEYKVLAVMVRRAGRVVRHQELLRRVWGPSAIAHVNYLRVYIRQLRSKLEPEPERPRHLVTVPGVGYRLNVA
jgi:two-component system KDP operon response regulator KdpE